MICGSLFSHIAQQVERLTVNQHVVGSSPTVRVARIFILAYINCSFTLLMGYKICDSLNQNKLILIAN